MNDDEETVNQDSCTDPSMLYNSERYVSVCMGKPSSASSKSYNLDEMVN